MNATRPDPVIIPGMRVLGEQSKTLGSIGQLTTDPTTGTLESFTVKHGLVRRRETRVLPTYVKQVNADSVVLGLNATDLKNLPQGA